MIVTKFGWLGLDPLRVPQAASMQLGVGDDFAQHLDAAAAANHDTPTESPVAAAPHRENEHSRAPEREAIASEPDEADGDTLATTDDAQETPSPAAAQAAGMQPQENQIGRAHV